MLVNQFSTFLACLLKCPIPSLFLSTLLEVKDPEMVGPHGRRGPDARGKLPERANYCCRSEDTTVLCYNTKIIGLTCCRSSLQC